MKGTSMSDLTPEEKDEVMQEINAQLDVVMPLAVEQMKRMGPAYEEVFLPLAEKIAKAFAKAFADEFESRGLIVKSVK
jgi:hypothetical protein